jgi:ABC-type dipeptide/oligopeptide/nickel transport system ATPase component
LDTPDRHHIYSVYFAPRGRERLLRLGEQLAHMHLSYRDRLIGIIGDAGSGKSLIVKGMFPGVSLSNDDDTIATDKVLQISHSELDNDFRTATYHIDMRFQMAFTQMYKIVEFVNGALEHNRRVIIEHFDLLYPALKINADVLIGIGEEIIVTRPNLFGPLPKDIRNVVIPSLQKRKTAHSAEDLTAFVLQRDYQVPFKEMKVSNSDVRGGFVLNFPTELDINLHELEGKVQALISQDLDISYYNENHIQIGQSEIIPCTGPRIHVRNTAEISNFQLLKEFRFDKDTDKFALVGTTRDKDIESEDFNQINKEESSS